MRGLPEAPIDTRTRCSHANLPIPVRALDARSPLEGAFGCEDGLEPHITEIGDAFGIVNIPIFAQLFPLAAPPNASIPRKKHVCTRPADNPIKPFETIAL